MPAQANVKTTWLFEVSKPGVASSYLFGSIHSSKNGFSNNPIQKSTLQAFASADRTVYEVDFNVAATSASEVLLSPALKGQAFTLSQLIGTESFNKLALHVSHILSKSQLEEFAPWQIYFLTSDLKTADVPVENFIDKLFFEMAQLSGKPTVALETIEEIQKLFLHGLTPERAKELIDSIDLKKIKDNTSILLEAYESIDLDKLEELISSNTTDIDKILTYERNSRWMSKINNSIEAGNSFIVVGAAHLIGDEGLIKKLRTENYQIHQINTSGEKIIPTSIEKNTDLKPFLDPEKFKNSSDEAYKMLSEYLQSPIPNNGLFSLNNLAEMLRRTAFIRYFAGLHGDASEAWMYNFTQEMLTHKNSDVRHIALRSYLDFRGVGEHDGYLTLTGELGVPVSVPEAFKSVAGRLVAHMWVTDTNEQIQVLCQRYIFNNTEAIAQYPKAIDKIIEYFFKPNHELHYEAVYLFENYPKNTEFKIAVKNRMSDPFWKQKIVDIIEGNTPYSLKLIDVLREIDFDFSIRTELAISTYNKFILKPKKELSILQIKQLDYKRRGAVDLVLELFLTGHAQNLLVEARASEDFSKQVFGGLLLDIFDTIGGIRKTNAKLRELLLPIWAKLFVDPKYLQNQSLSIVFNILPQLLRLNTGLDPGVLLTLNEVQQLKDSDNPNAQRRLEQIELFFIENILSKNDLPYSNSDIATFEKSFVHSPSNQCLNLFL